MIYDVGVLGGCESLAYWTCLGMGGGKLANKRLVLASLVVTEKGEPLVRNILPY